MAKKVRRFNGEDDSYVEGTATSLRDDTEDQLRQDQMKRAAQLANKPEAMGEGNPKYNFDEFTAFQQESPPKDPFAEAAPAAPAAPKAKPPIVTLQQLNAFKKEFGADKDLTDYMNKQQGLTRRGGATPPVSRNDRQMRDTSIGLGPTVEKAPPKLKYQSLQDRAEEYAMKNKAAGMGMYGTKKSEPATGTPKRSKNLTDMLGLSSNYASGGKVRSASSRADGIAIRGKTRA